MKIRKYGKGMDEDRVINLDLIEVGDNVTLVIVDDEGIKEPLGDILKIRHDGKLELYKGLGDYGLVRDSEGRIVMNWDL